MGRDATVLRAACSAAAAWIASGCVLAAAGAGAGGGIYLTSRGVESVVAAPVARTFSAAERAFRELGVKPTGSRSEDEGRRRELTGETGDGEIDVTVSLKSEGASSTKVEVTARKSLVTWDKDFARRVLEKIVEFSR